VTTEFTCQCTSQTSIRMICNACKRKRQRILGRLRARRFRGSDQPNGSVYLDPDTVAELLKGLDVVRRAEEAVRDDADKRGDYVAGPTKRLMEGVSIVRQALSTQLAEAEAERVEIDRPQRRRLGGS